MRIHKPKMEIHTLSRKEAENIENHYPQHFDPPSSSSSSSSSSKGNSSNSPPEKISIISIGPPGEKTADLNESLFENVLRLRFDDASPEADTAEGIKLMDSAQAEEIWRFVDFVSPDVLFVQCQAGQSRSCGVAYALHEHINDGDLKQGWENFNRYAYGKVREELSGTSWSQQTVEKLFQNND